MACAGWGWSRRWCVVPVDGPGARTPGRARCWADRAPVRRERPARGHRARRAADPAAAGRRAEGPPDRGRQRPVPGGGRATTAGWRWWPARCSTPTAATPPATPTWRRPATAPTWPVPGPCSARPATTPPTTPVASRWSTSATRPTREHVETLKGSGATSLVSETLHAIDVDRRRDPPVTRSILVTGQYGNFGSGGNKPMEVYDVTGDRCEHPVHLGTVVWPENIHNLTISGNGRYVFATQPTQVVDISPMFDGKPYVLPRQPRQRHGLPARRRRRRAPTSTTPSPARASRACRRPTSGTRRSRPTTARRSSSARRRRRSTSFTIADIGPWLERNPDGTPKGMPVIRSQRAGRGPLGHEGLDPGPRRLGHARRGERVRRRLRLRPERAQPVRRGRRACLHGHHRRRRPADARQHVRSRDQPARELPGAARLRRAGVGALPRVRQRQERQDRDRVDAERRHPRGRRARSRPPREIAYFNPGDVDAGPGVRLDNAWGHPRYDAKTGQIWFATASGGFWVVELEPQVRQLPPAPAAGTRGPPERRTRHPARRARSTSPLTLELHRRGARSASPRRRSDAARAASAGRVPFDGDGVLGAVRHREAGPSPRARAARHRRSSTLDTP